ncbi:acyltransferase [Streptomyces halstedii]|uniref:acyltransferase n=1 Tax=Streptomyces halstedii TaxID=1944 RepID=UPI00345FB094
MKTVAEDGRFPGVDLRVGRSRIGVGVEIGRGSVIVADELVLGDGARVGAGCDLRSAHLELAAAAQVAERGRLLVADRLRVGAGSRLDTDASVVCRSLDVGAGSYIGQRWQVGAGATMEEHSTVTVGDNCQIAPDVVFNATEPVVIGSGVGISAHVAVFTHGYHSGHAVRDGHAAAFAGVVVRDGVWLGFRATLLPGVEVGEGTVVAATATVTRSLPPGVLAAGVPATVRRALTPQPLDDTGRRRAVDALVESWLRRLAFKGLDVRRAGPVWEVSDGSGGAWRVRSAGSAGRCEVTVGSGRGEAVFVFAEPLAVQGELDVLGHDLRDFCRRATWMFPYRTNSTGVVPERFARLLG